MIVDKNKVLSIAEAEVGYLEKATNSQLNDKTANAGDANWTKYGLAMGCNGQPWCDAFVDWCFVQAYGKETAKKLLGGFSNWTPASYSYLNKVSISEAQATDIIFFKDSSGTICHTGIIYKVTSSMIYTIEGNTSSAAGVVANGGAVAKKQYYKTNNKIVIGRPYWDDNTSATSGSVTQGQQGNTNQVQQGNVTQVQQVGGNCNVVLNTLKIGSKGAQVKALQILLIGYGYSCGSYGADGDFGNGTLAAVKKFQQAKKLEVDGIVGANTWNKLLKG